MAQRRIDKPVVAHFLESTKEVLEHINRWTVETSARGQEAPKGLTQIYGSTRRLRDYLQRSLSAFPQPVLIDLSNEDEQLLASCFLHTVGTLDTELAKPQKSSTDRKVLEQKRAALGEWAVEFSTRMPTRIPNGNRAEVNTPNLRSILSAITKKVSARMGFDEVSTITTQKMIAGRPGPGFGGVPQAADACLEPNRPKIDTFRSGFGGGEPEPVSGPVSFGPIGVPESPGTPGMGSMDQPARLESALGQVVGHSERELETVIDVKRIKDPRLRTMLGLDTRAFDRALSAGDARLALVHLYSIFEAGVLDHALNRRGELGLHGNVESWSLEGILQKALGDRLAIADRALLIGLISGRSLVRPAIQLVSPLAVTAVSLKDSMALVRRIFIELGLIGSGQPDGAKLALSTPGSQPQPLPNPQALHSAGSGWSGIHKAQGS